MRGTRPNAPDALADERIEALYRDEYRRMVGVARLLVGPASAEEVVHDAFVRLIAKWPRLGDRDRAAGYLHRTVVNVARGRLRRRATGNRLALTLPVQRPPEQPDDAAMRDDDRARVADALQQLSRRQQECLVLRYFAGLTEAETGVALGIATGSVKSHVHRALASLERVMEGGR